MEDTDWRPSPCPGCGVTREAARQPVCENKNCEFYLKMNVKSYSQAEKNINEMVKAKMITAKEARELAGPTLEEQLDEQLEYAYDRIRSAAEKKYRVIRLHNEFWRCGDYNQTDLYKKAVKELEKLGYTVKFHYEARHAGLVRQFVDMYTIVEW